jgi:thioredoxin 2
LPPFRQFQGRAPSTLAGSSSPAISNFQLAIAKFGLRLSCINAGQSGGQDTMTQKASHLYFRCSKCGTVNRLARGRENEGSKCGQCKDPLDTQAKPAEVSDEGLAKLVKQRQVPVLIDFWAPWCGPCRAFAPQLEAYAKKHGGEILVAKINTDEHKEFANALQVQGIPTIALFVGGAPVAVQSGAMSLVQLERWVNDGLSGAAQPA